MSSGYDVTQKHFAATSQLYAVSAGHAQDSDLAMLVDLLELNATHQVLDVATGAGHTALAIAPFVAQVTAADLTPEMLDRTAELAAKRNITNIVCAVTPAEQLNFPNDTFDRVSCRIAPHHFLDPQKAVTEMARVLNSGGICVIEDSVAPDDMKLDMFINTIEKVRDPTHIRSYTLAEWLAFFTGADLTVEKIEYFRKKHDFADWLARGAQDPAAQTETVRLACEANEESRKYFAIEYDQHGQPISFMDDKILFKTVKTQR